MKNKLATFKTTDVSTKPSYVMITKLILWFLFDINVVSLLTNIHP